MVQYYLLVNKLVEQQQNIQNENWVAYYFS